jgi:hypothetical protein
MSFRQAQHRQPDSAQHVQRQSVQQSGQERPIARVETHFLITQLSLQHRDLMA